MDELDFDINTGEVLERLGCSQTKLTRLVNKGILNRVPKNPGSVKGRGSGWLYSSQQLDAYMLTLYPTVISKSTPKPLASIPFEPKKSWWKKIFS